MPGYLAESGLADEEIDEDEYLTVPFDISERMGELEPDGRNVPEAKRKSPSMTMKRKTSSPCFWEPPSEETLCDIFGLKPSTVIHRATPRGKKRKEVRRG